MNELVNDSIKLLKLEINNRFINGLSKKWLSLCQSLRNTNHVKDSELASLFGKLKYKENLIDNIYETEKKKSLVSATPFSQEYLNDLEEEYQARDLLAKSKRFFKKDTQRFRSAKATDQTECHKCGKKDEEEMSLDDNEMVEVKVLMALAKDNEAVSKEGAKNGEWVKISMIKENVNYQSSRRLYNLSFLEYLKLYFFEYEHVAVNLTRHGLDTATIGKPVEFKRISLTGFRSCTSRSRYQSKQHGKSESLSYYLPD
ncbi:hypothetical protein Tco_0079214 [Tanacetum coccineum]